MAKGKIIKWIEGDLSKFADRSFIERFKHTPRGTTKVAIYTDENQYIFTAKGNYLGCMAINRKKLAGETHHRGSDLADGTYTLKTFRKILGDIVSYELVKVHKPVTPRGPSVNDK